MKFRIIGYCLFYFFVNGSSQTSFSNNSILKDGQLFKFSVTESGVYKITGSLLQKAGLTLNVNPQNIKVFTFPGGPLEETIIPDQILNDLYEVPVEVIGGADGRFDQNDEIFFYVEGASLWKFHAVENSWEYNKNVYDNKSYIYIKIDQTPSKKINSTNTSFQPEISSTVYELKQSFEEDKINLLTLTINTQGSGQQWFGDNFKAVENRPFSAIDLTKYISNENINVQALFATRSPSSSTVDFFVGAERIRRNTSGVFLNSIETNFASLANFDIDVKPQSAKEGIKVSFSSSSSNADAWIDYIRTIGYSPALYAGDQLFVSDRKMIGKSGKISFQTGNFDVNAWKIKAFNQYETVPFFNKELFIQKSDSLSEYILFHRAGVKTPEFESKVNNQNLHGSNGGQWVVIHPDSLTQQAIKLSNLRKNQFEVQNFSLEQILDEFGGGRKDPTAIRNFCKMLHERKNNFKYLLLLGDATYDARNIQNENKDHFHIPVYQTKASLHPVLAFPSDDYYGLLSKGEGGDLIGSIEVAVGRIPVRNKNEADGVINKIIEFETNIKRFGEWRSNVVISADDEDGNLHIIQADRLAEKIEASTPEFLVKKKFLDAFKQLSTPAGQRYPDVNFDINSEINQGALVFCYLGHGGPSGLAEERVVQVADIQSWQNIPKLPILVTATCTFTSYDSPKNVSAGEFALINPKGGAIALFSTVRAVYASENERITNSVFNFLLPQNREVPKTLGDVLISAKNFQRFDTISANTRKFGLFGDPGQQVSTPQYKINLDSINGINTNQFKDTITAFEKIILKGSVVDKNNSIQKSFNGKLNLTIFDKPSLQKTVINDPENSYTHEFEQFRNIIFKGQASIENGVWKLEIIIPSDINYAIGKGKVQFYGHNEKFDASGSFSDLFIGGEPKSAFRDDTPPLMSLFINDQKFKSGGITNNKPTIIVNLKDDTGIKVTGTSIGHDLTLKLIGIENKSYILNEFYVGNLNDPSSGTARFTLPQLKPGKYQAIVKAWDLGNNSVEKSIEFVVVDSDSELQIKTFNYPNPFNSQTKIFFEHDFNNQEVEIETIIYDYQGKLVKKIYDKRFTESSSEEVIVWDGADDNGINLPKGMYLYKIKINSTTLSQKRESEYRNILKL